MAFSSWALLPAAVGQGLGKAWVIPAGSGPPGARSPLETRPCALCLGPVGGSPLSCSPSLRLSLFQKAGKQTPDPSWGPGTPPPHPQDSGQRKCSQEQICKLCFPLLSPPRMRDLTDLPQAQDPGKPRAKVRSSVPHTSGAGCLLDGQEKVRAGPKGGTSCAGRRPGS